MEINNRKTTLQSPMCSLCEEYSSSPSLNFDEITQIILDIGTENSCIDDLPLHLQYFYKETLEKIEHCTSKTQLKKQCSFFLGKYLIKENILRQTTNHFMFKSLNNTEKNGTTNNKNNVHSKFNKPGCDPFSESFIEFLTKKLWLEIKRIFS